MIENSNSVTVITNMAKLADISYSKKLSEDITTEEKLLDDIFKNYKYPIEIKWIINTAQHLINYKILTGDDYVIKNMEDSII